MGNFHTNQSRHLYVATAYNASVTEASATGTIGAFKVADGELHFLYKGADTVLKSDRIQLKNLDYAKAVKAVSMRVPFKSIKVTLASAAMSSSKPLEGVDYILGINFRQFYGMSDADTYYKDAVVHVTSGMTATQFYAAMAAQLNLAFSREVGATKTSNPYLTFSSSSAGLVITEKAQDWHLGLGSPEQVQFEVIPSTIYNGAADVVWGELTDVTTAKASITLGTDGRGNGQDLAELEWFCMGERGDQYRMAGYPNYIPTTYLTDPTKEYHVLELHHAFTDTGVNSYRSEKDITIIVPKDAATGEGATIYDTINAIIGAINTAAGTSIATLAD